MSQQTRKESTSAFDSLAGEAGYHVNVGTSKAQLSPAKLRGVSMVAAGENQVSVDGIALPGIEGTSEARVEAEPADARASPIGVFYRAPAGGWRRPRPGLCTKVAHELRRAHFVAVQQRAWREARASVADAQRMLHDENMVARSHQGICAGQSSRVEAALSA